MAAKPINRAFIWFIIGLVFITLGMSGGKRRHRTRSRAFAAVGVVFLVVGFVQSRRGTPPTA